MQPGITGPGRYIYADAIMDAYAGAYTGEEWITITATSVNSKNKPGKWNWDSFLGFSGYEFLGNFGFLTKKLPDVSSKDAEAAEREGRRAHVQGERRCPEKGQSQPQDDPAVTIRS